jgi:hypothetical protein
MRVTTDEREHVLQLERGVLPAGGHPQFAACARGRAGPQQETFCRMLAG